MATIDPVKGLRYTVLAGVLVLVVWSATTALERSEDPPTDQGQTAPAPLVEQLAEDGPVQVVGVMGTYGADPGPVRAVIRTTQEEGYLQGTDADFRVRHAVITCERVAFQSWDWEKQVDADVANGVAPRAARTIANLLESEFCEALDL